MFHVDGSQPDSDQIFVFGSNLAGKHGGGAAAAAMNYGTEWGVGVGLSRMTYAIPTMDEQLQVLPAFRISDYIDEFIDFTEANRDRSFFVTRVGCGIAGYKDKEIAPLFFWAVNCSFAIEWKAFLNEAAMLKRVGEINLLRRDDARRRMCEIECGTLVRRSPDTG